MAVNSDRIYKLIKQSQLRKHRILILVSSLGCPININDMNIAFSLTAEQVGSLKML